MTKYTVEVTESIDYERDDDRTLVDCLTDGERSVWWNSEDGLMAVEDADE